MLDERVFQEIATERRREPVELLFVEPQHIPVRVRGNRDERTFVHVRFLDVPALDERLPLVVVDNGPLSVLHEVDRLKFAGHRLEAVRLSQGTELHQRGRIATQRDVRDRELALKQRVILRKNLDMLADRLKLQVLPQERHGLVDVHALGLKDVAVAIHAARRENAIVFQYGTVRDAGPVAERLNAHVVVAVREPSGGVGKFRLPFRFVADPGHVACGRFVVNRLHVLGRRANAPTANAAAAFQRSQYVFDCVSHERIPA